MKAAVAVTRFSVAIVLLLCGGVFLLDSVSYGLAPADPITGKARGCYTLVETWLGYLEPSDAVRIAQTLVSLSVVVVALTVLVRVAVKCAAPKSRSIGQ